MNVVGSSRTDLRPLLERSYRAAVEAADPARIVAGALPEPPAGRLVVLGAGKAAAAMAAAVAEHYRGYTDLSGLVLVPGADDGNEEASFVGPIEIRQASHPVPDQRGVVGTERILALAEECGAEDLVLVLLSGGGSSLLCSPDGLTLEEKADLTDRLLRSGAGIVEMNVVRKHLSRVKGGRLAQAAAPARLVGLVLSDVVGDDLASIASGPTVTDPSTFQDALDVLDRYGVESTRARALFEAGVRGERMETPKPGDAALSHARTLLVGSNQGSLEAASRVLSEAGFPAHILSSTITGEAREAAGLHAAVARQIIDLGQPFTPPCALISGGETTVTVRGSGRGGRNGEFGLALALALPADAPVWALTADTDGVDGSEANAGVFVTPELLREIERSDAARLLAANDSYTLFEKSDCLFNTGPTGTNVNDLRIIVIEQSQNDAAGRPGEG